MRMFGRIALAAALALAAGPVLAQGVPGVPAMAACQPRVADAELVKPRTLVMSTNPTLPPLQYVDSGGQLQGLRVELGNEIARRLCLTPEYVRIEFSAMVPGLAARRWDMINTGIFYTEERARLMQMIRYENNAVAISAARGNPLNVRAEADLAGRTVGVELGGFEERSLRAMSERIVAAGGRPINIRTFDNFAVAFQALRVGQLEGVASIDAVAAEYDRRGEFRRALHGINATPAALAFRSRALADAVSRVFAEMTADGSLGRLFERYGVEVAPGGFAVAGPS